MEPTVTWYTILGIEKEATQAEIKKAYKQRALVTHPDKLDPNASEAIRQVAEAQFRQVRLAYETLSDLLQRKAYDYTLRAPGEIPANLHVRASTFFEEYQAKLAREREDWARKNEEKHRERMKTPNGTPPITPSDESKHRPDLPRGRSGASTASANTSGISATTAAEDTRQARPPPRAPSQDDASPKPRYARAASSMSWAKSQENASDTPPTTSHPASPPFASRPAPPSPEKPQSRPLPRPPPARASTSAIPRTARSPPAPPQRRATQQTSPRAATTAAPPPMSTSPVRRSCAADVPKPSSLPSVRAPLLSTRTSFPFPAPPPVTRLSFTASAPPLAEHTSDDASGDASNVTANVQWETLLGAPISDVEPDLREVDEEVELDPALLAERMLRQLRASNPEWEARRKEVLLRQRTKTQPGFQVRA